MRRPPSPAQRAVQITFTLKGHLKNVQVAYIRVAALLARVRDEKLYRALGHATMDAYAAARLGLQHAALYRDLEVYDWIREFHRPWLERRPKGFIPQLTDAYALMWIERRLQDPHLGDALRAQLEALRRKALAGQLTLREFQEVRRQGHAGAPPLRPGPNESPECDSARGRGRSADQAHTPPLLRERRAARCPLRQGRGEVAARAPALRSPHAVQPRPVVPQDLPLRRLGERQLQERRDGMRVLRVGVRVVRREDQVLVAEPLHVLLDRRLVRLDGEEAVRAEVLRRLLPHLRHLVASHPLPVLVEAVEEPRRPAAVALEEPDAETREALEHAAGTEAHGDEHDAQRLAEGVPHDELVEDLE